MYLKSIFSFIIIFKIIFKKNKNKNKYKLLKKKELTKIIILELNFKRLIKFRFQ